MNLGSIDYVNRTYKKYVSFNKAVLWKTRQLSLPLPTLEIIKRSGIEKLIFIDNTKKEIWEFDTDRVLKNGQRKLEGQEPQWYFPIELADKYGTGTALNHN